MINTDKHNFIKMMNVTMGLTNRFPLTDDEIKSWWAALVKYEFDLVRGALDAWVDSSRKPPTPFDIKGLCKPKQDFSKALPKPVNSDEVNAAGLKKLEQVITTNLKPRTDYHSWFKRILRNPKNFPDDSVKEARRVALEFGYDLSELEATA